MENVTLSIEQYGRLTGKTRDQIVKELFEKGEEGTLTQKATATEVISSHFTDKFKAVGDDFHKKGVKEAWDQVKGALLAEQDFDPGDLTGKDLLGAYGSFKAKVAAKNASTLSKEELEKNELVRAYVEEHTQKAREALKAFKEEAERTAASQKTKVKKIYAKQLLLENLPQWEGIDKEERQRRVSVLSELLGNRLDYLDFDDDGTKPKLKDPKTGEVLVDKELNPLPYSSWLESFNPYPASTRKPETPAPGTSKPGTSGDFRVTSKEDFERQLAKAATPDERARVNSAYADFLEKNGQ